MIFRVLSNMTECLGKKWTLPDADCQGISIARDNPNCWSIIPYTINSSNQMWCKCFQSRLYELQNRERISLAAASKLLSNMAMLMPLSNTLIVVMIDRAWVSPWVWWSLGMTRRDPGSVMLTGVNIVQLDYLSHIKGLSVWSLIATQRLRENKWELLFSVGSEDIFAYGVLDDRYDMIWTLLL